MTDDLTVLEICAGAGGQSLGLEWAGFSHLAAVEYDVDACETLRLNREREWHVVEMDVHDYSAKRHNGQVSLLAGGVPCPPFSVAGKQLGADDERDLFPQALRLVAECNPDAVMLENVKGLSSAKFADYRDQVLSTLSTLGYESDWRLLNASDYGVPQLRPRFILVALKPAVADHFEWPKSTGPAPTVGDKLRDLMAADGWTGIDEWVKKASGIGPTLVGGSRKHGGPDLGPTRAREAWARLGVNGKVLADAPPSSADSAELIPKLTTQMAAIIQGFPSDWLFSGRKTARYRQIGNAFPPPVAAAIGRQIRTAIRASRAVTDVALDRTAEAVSA